ncbi:GntR family transcriptional regulator [Phaeobacter inhibens]|nr:GntR family transcriptional regulator [Phaeobacter inhibens]
MRMKSADKTTPVKTSKEVDERVIVDRIFKAVMAQRLAPKTKLSEAELCDTFGVGRMKVRRALLLLSNQGIVDLQSNRGAYIACPDAKEANDVFEARLHIEPSIVKDLVDYDDDRNLAALRDHVLSEKRAKEEGTRPEAIRLSGEFHVKMVAATGNDLLTKIIRELVTRTSLIVGLFGSGRGTSCREDEHEEIIRAIENKNKEKAVRLVTEHLVHIKDGLELKKPTAIESNLSNILRLAD